MFTSTIRRTAVATIPAVAPVASVFISQPDSWVSGVSN